MNRLNEFLPESCYEQQNLSTDDVKEALSNHKTIIGKVVAMDQAEETLSVQIGNGIIAKLPFSEATIYPYTFSKTTPEFKVPHQISCIYGKIICAKVISVLDDQIVLSRKQSMLEAFEAIKGKEMLPFFVSKATAHHVYGDIGYGLQAKIYIRDLCKSNIRSTTEICNTGDCFLVKVLNVDDIKQFNVSYKETFPVYDPANYKCGDTLIARVGNAVDNKLSGFFVYITPQICGILDYNSNFPFIRYGDTVECKVKRANAKGLHLIFIRVLDRAKI